MLVVVVMAAVEVTAPVAPVVVNGLRFKAKPEAVVVPVAVLVVAALVVPGAFNPNPSVPRLAVPVEGAPSERPVVVDDAGAAELATDANKVGPVEPRTEVVLVEAVVAAVDVTPSLAPKDRAGPELVLVVSVAVGALVAAVEVNNPKFRPVLCPPRLKGAADWVAAPKVAAEVAAAAGAAPKLSPAGAVCGAAAPMLTLAAPA